MSTATITTATIAVEMVVRRPGDREYPAHHSFLSPAPLSRLPSAMVPLQGAMAGSLSEELQSQVANCEELMEFTCT